MVTSSADAYSEPVASCVVCGDQATRSPSDVQAGDAAAQLAALPPTLPTPDLCAEHWDDYQTDWLLLGWCVDHYGQALTQCPVHQREIQPL
jgi:hypothetical protein